jgi:hypothetical protein
MKPTDQQVREAFYNKYQDEHNGSLKGVEAEFQWWLDPTQKCLVQDSPRKGPRCTMICATCRRTP